MSKVREKIKLTSYDELLKVEITDGLKEIDVDKLHDFSNHPFKVSDDEKMEELTESIRERGVLLPILVRKTNDEEYEIISGHRRTHAARLAGIEKVPVIIRELSDDDATIVMVDSNIQREEILPSEKAYAFQMKLEAIQHKGIKGEESREVVGEANGLSGRQVSRYIKLTNLLPELDGMVNLIVETIISENDYIVISSTKFPKEAVKSRFSKLDISHIEYVLECMNHNTTNIKNIKKYLLAALYNAPTTIDSYYKARVQHDMPELAN